ncbi:hypothetical protein AYO38_10875 [bacterium SCGC AG-212-C10]|nr:hypothetical protein AYO38_10875 [bacterium SCGC AG-212-C10]
MTMEPEDDQTPEEAPQDQEDSSESWYFDLPSGAWERQEQKNRDLRSILLNHANEPEKPRAFGPSSQAPQSSEQKTGRFGFGRRKDALPGARNIQPRFDPLDTQQPEFDWESALEGGEGREDDFANASATPLFPQSGWTPEPPRDDVRDTRAELPRADPPLRIRRREGGDAPLAYDHEDEGQDTDPTADVTLIDGMRAWATGRNAAPAERAPRPAAESASAFPFEDEVAGAMPGEQPQFEPPALPQLTAPYEPFRNESIIDEPPPAKSGTREMELEWLLEDAVNVSADWEAERNAAKQRGSKPREGKQGKGLLGRFLGKKSKDQTPAVPVPEESEWIFGDEETAPAKPQASEWLATPEMIGGPDAGVPQAAQPFALEPLAAGEIPLPASDNEWSWDTLAAIGAGELPPPSPVVASDAGAEEPAAAPEDSWDSLIAAGMNAAPLSELSATDVPEPVPAAAMMEVDDPWEAFESGEDSSPVAHASDYAGMENTLVPDSNAPLSAFAGPAADDRDEVPQAAAAAAEAAGDELGDWDPEPFDEFFAAEADEPAIAPRLEPATASSEPFSSDSSWDEPEMLDASPAEDFFASGTVAGEEVAEPSPFFEAPAPSWQDAGQEPGDAGLVAALDTLEAEDDAEAVESWNEPETAAAASVFSEAAGASWPAQDASTAADEDPWSDFLADEGDDPQTLPPPRMGRGLAPQADSRPRSEDPWAAIVAASGYDESAEDPAPVALEFGGARRGPSALDEDLIEPAAHRDDHEDFERAEREIAREAADSAQQWVPWDASKQAPLVTEDEGDERDLVLRAFEAHAANAPDEVEPEREDPVARIRRAKQEPEQFEELLGEDAAELVDEAAGPADDTGFTATQAWAPQRTIFTDAEEAAPWAQRAAGISESREVWRPGMALGGAAGGDDAAPPWADASEEHENADAAGRSRSRSIVRELVETGLLAVLVFLSVRASFQNFKVDGTSMFPTLENGQFLIVNKLVYSEVNVEKLSKFVPFIDPGDDPKRDVFHGPERGDIIVLKDPRKPDTDLIKRVIGLPGETVEIVDGHVYINGFMLDEPYIKKEWHDEHRAAVTIPDGEYFVMGDNRDNSLDSRSQQVGLVPRELIIGKAMLSYWPSSQFGFAPNEEGKVTETQKPTVTTKRLGE